MAGGVEETESDAAVDAAANENGDSERLLRHGAAEVWLQVGGTEELGGAESRPRVEWEEVS